MVAKSIPRQNQNQNPAGIRRRSTAEKPREQLHTAKQAQYQGSSYDSILFYPFGTRCFTVTPDEERLMLLNEVEDSQVTSLVRKLRSGEPFEVEDFPGGDGSFSPKLEIKDAGGLVKDEKLGPDPVHRRNLRPRKAVPVEIEDISSSGDSERVVPPCSGR
ncbi:hypothetical protein Bca52824_016975 [Brassica carinata]|uniref:Uncharacterized protein n=1 Tax=Brassica carinata TaxID=52824 RepID=A0A8X8AWY1_BRACI|nr:hypothetical protein Bca52824_016975 [Brassica carinata]